MFAKPPGSPHMAWMLLTLYMCLCLCLFFFLSVHLQLHAKRQRTQTRFKYQVPHSTPETHTHTLPLHLPPLHPPSVHPPLPNHLLSIHLNLSPHSLHLLDPARPPSSRPRSAASYTVTVFSHQTSEELLFAMVGRVVLTRCNGSNFSS